MVQHHCPTHCDCFVFFSSKKLKFHSFFIQGYSLQPESNMTCTCYQVHVFVIAKCRGTPGIGTALSSH